MLMNITGLSEDKAVSIYKEFPTMKSFMDAIEQERIDSQKKLANTQVAHNYNEEKTRRLGHNLQCNIRLRNKRTYTK